MATKSKSKKTKVTKKNPKKRILGCNKKQSNLSIFDSMMKALDFKIVNGLAVL